MKKKREGGESARLVGLVQIRAGPVGSVRFFLPFFSLSFILFCFLFFIITFARQFQIQSNQILEISKIQHNLVK
jgi:hypothetical protein